MGDYFLLSVTVAEDGSVTNSLQLVNNIDTFFKDSTEKFQALEDYDFTPGDLESHSNMKGTTMGKRKKPLPGHYYCLIDSDNTKVLGKAKTKQGGSTRKLEKQHI